MQKNFAESAEEKTYKPLANWVLHPENKAIKRRVTENSKKDGNSSMIERFFHHKRRLQGHRSILASNNER